MKTQQLLQESRHKKNPGLMIEDREVSTDDDLLDLFPQPRYFQVHFQHIHENTRDIQNELVQLTQIVAKVDEKLERLTSLLSRLSEHAP